MALESCAQGTVKSFNPVGGWGFITCDGFEYFVHSAFIQEGRTLAPGEPVAFLKWFDKRRQKWQAKNVTRLASGDDVCEGIAQRDSQKETGKGKSKGGKCRRSRRARNARRDGQEGGKGGGKGTFNRSELLNHAEMSSGVHFQSPTCSEACSRHPRTISIQVYSVSGVDLGAYKVSAHLTRWALDILGKHPPPDTANNRVEFILNDTEKPLVKNVPLCQQSVADSITITYVVRELNQEEQKERLLKIRLADLGFKNPIGRFKAMEPLNLEGSFRSLTFPAGQVGGYTLVPHFQARHEVNRDEVKNEFQQSLALIKQMEQRNQAAAAARANAASSSTD